MVTTATTGGSTLTVGDAIVDVANRLGVDPILALAQAWAESGLNPKAKGDYGTESNGVFTAETAGTPGGSYTSFGLYQLHKGGELGNLTPTQAFNPITNATVALTNVAGVAKANPGASPGEIAALAGRPGPGTSGETEAQAMANYANEINTYYEDISRGDYPAGFEAAFKAPVSGDSTGTTGTAQTPPTGSGGTASTTDITLTAANTSGSHGFLHTMQSVLNVGPIDDAWYTYFYGKGEIDTALNIVLVAFARAAVVLVGAGFILTGAVILVLDFSKIYLGSNKFLAPLERLQRLTLTPQRVSQAERRLSLSETRATPTDADYDAFNARMARLRIDLSRENRARAARGQPLLNLEDYVR